MSSFEGKFKERRKKKKIWKEDEDSRTKAVAILAAPRRWQRRSRVKRMVYFF